MVDHEFTTAHVADAAHQATFFMGYVLPRAARPPFPDERVDGGRTDQTPRVVVR